MTKTGPSRSAAPATPPPTWNERIDAAEQALTAARLPAPAPGADAWPQLVAADRSSALQRVRAIRDLIPGITAGDQVTLATAATLALEAAHTASSLRQVSPVLDLARQLHTAWSDAECRRMRAAACVRAA